MDQFHIKNRSLSSLSEDSEDDAHCSGLPGKRPRVASNSAFSNSTETQSMATSDEETEDDELRPAFGMGRSDSFSNDDSADEKLPNNGTNKRSSSNISDTYSGPAQKMMKSMGYEIGQGLGKFRQGMVAPVEASNQRGRRGFGFSVDGFEPSRDLEWDGAQELIEVEEAVSWIPSCPDNPPDTFILNSWYTEGPVKMTIHDETNFIDPKLLEGVLSAKTVFDKLDSKEMMRARTRSNPFETLGKLFFLNRAALKMANMDAITNFMFTRPKFENGESMVMHDEVLFFADVCAAPGGFSEYVLWKRKENCNGFCDAKGFGFTLKENDFKLHDFFAAPSEFFEPHYGVEGDGNVYTPKNINSFREFVLSSTFGRGVHFMMADGGFSVEGQENIQEILSKRLYLCQFIVALGIVRTGGHFVCKLFDIFTQFSVGLVYLMYRSFKEVSLHKPNTSRPANSERYIICKWKREDVSDVYDYLFEMNERLDCLGKDSKMDVMELVPLKKLQADKEFFSYIVDSNNSFAHQQIIGLSKIKAFAQNTTLIEDKQLDVRTRSLKFWELPDKSRVARVRSDAKSKFQELMGGKSQIEELKSSGPEELNCINKKNKIHSLYDYRCVTIGSSKDGRKDRGFYLSLGGCSVFKWDGRQNSVWTKIDASIEIPPDTLVYGELVTEYKGEFKAQRKFQTFHLIDGLFLNGFDVRYLHLVERHNHLKKFAMAINKPSQKDLVPIKCKTLFKLDQISEFLLPRLEMKLMKGSANYRRVFCDYEGEPDKNLPMIIPTGLILLKQTKNPWMMAFSKSSGRKYWFNTMTQKSTYEVLQEVIAPFTESYNEGLIWWWDYGVQILESDYTMDDKLHLKDLAQ